MKLTLKKFIILVPAVVAALSACNSTTEETENLTGLENESSTLVRSFSIKPNAKVMLYLDSVYFSIDQVRGEIFNADSLPWGTDVRRLVVSVQIPSTSGVEIVMPKLSDGTDTVINLLKNSGDSINFSRGSVWMRVTSADGEYERIYTVRVNVHNCNPDSLQWNMRPEILPSSLSGLKKQKAVEFGDGFYCMSANGSSVEMARASHPGQFHWDTDMITSLPADVSVGSLTAAPDAMYVISESGKLLSSTDGTVWSETAAPAGWTHLYGSFGNDIVGVRNGRWATWPGGAEGDIPAGMPVSETSAMWTFTNEWAIEPQAMFAGGVLADGSYSGLAWGFDGRGWMQLSGYSGDYMLPQAAGMTVFPYFTFRTDNKTFVTSRRSAWIALGGRLADGTMQKGVYVSLDNGVNWRKAPEDLQLPAEIRPRSGADVLLGYKSFTASRAVKPITEWDAPYIYMFGGYDASGRLFNQVWTGVINRMIFKPLQ